MAVNKRETEIRSKQVGQITSAKAGWRRATPGMPNAPSLPSRPKSDGKDKEKDREEERKYERDRAERMRDYERALSKWQSKDRERREQLINQRQAAETAVAALNQQAEQREADRDAIREENNQLRQQYQEIDSQYRLAKAVLDADLKPAALYMPANFDLISYTAESARLERSIPK